MVVQEPRTDVCARCTCGTDGCPHGEPGRCPPEEFATLADVAGGGELVSSLLVPLMEKSSRRSGLTEMGHSPGMVRTTAMNFPRMDATPGDSCTIDLDMMLVTEFPRTDATPGDRYAIGREVMTVPIFPRTSATTGELCTMDVGFRPDVDIPRTSSNPGEKSAGELGYGAVLGFSQVDSTQSRCGAVELGLCRANCPPGEIGAKECGYIMPALLAGSSELECLPYQGKDCIKDFSAGRTLSPSVSDLSGPRGPYVTDDPVGHPGMLSSSTFMTEILMDPGGMLPSSDLAGMLLPAIPVSPVGFWGTLSSSDSDPDGPYGADGPVGHLWTLSLSTSTYERLKDPGGTSPSSGLAGMRGPAPLAEPAVRRDPVGPAVSSETLTPFADVPELCRSVMTVGLCPEVTGPLPDQRLGMDLIRIMMMNTEYGRDRIMRRNMESPRLAVTPGEWYASDILATMNTDLRQMNGIPDVIGAMKDCRTVWGFPQIDSATVDCGTVELNDMIFRRTSFPLDELRDGDFMKDCRTVWGFPQMNSAAVDCSAVELDDLIFRRMSFPPCETGVVVYSYSPATIHSAEHSALVDKTL